MWCAAALCVVAWAVPGWAEDLGVDPTPVETGREQQTGSRPDDDGEPSTVATAEPDQDEDDEGSPPAPDTSDAETADEDTGTSPDQGRHGVKLDGPSSVQSQILRDRESHQLVGPQTLKDRLQSRYSLALGADYNVLAQQINDSPGQNDGVTGVTRFYGHWALVGRDDPIDVGSLVFKVEYRNSLGTDIPAQAVLPTAGVAGVSGPTFGANGGMLTNLFWTQAFADNRFAFSAGVVDPTDYLDVYGLVNVWTDFNNLAFSTNPTIQIPNQGLGAVARWMFSENLYLVGGFADANADPHRPQDFFSTFGEGEYFKHVELGWMGSWKGRFSDNAHITLWEVDDREEAGIEGGWGATVSWSENLGDRWLGFVRGGYSDSGGTLVDRTVSAGFGYMVNDQESYFGFGINWGRAPDVDRNQYQFETYYRTFLSRGLSVVPSVQYIRDPAYNPEISNLWLLGLRLRAVW
jgi:porin